MRVPEGEKELTLIGGRRAKEPRRKGERPDVGRVPVRVAGGDAKPGRGVGKEVHSAAPARGRRAGERVSSDEEGIRSGAVRGGGVVLTGMSGREGEGLPRARGADRAAGKERRTGRNRDRASGGGEKAESRKDASVRWAGRKGLDEHGGGRGAERGAGGPKPSSEVGPEPGGHGRKRDPRRWRRTLLAVLLLVSLAAMVWVYLFTDVLNVRLVEVRGNRNLSADYLRSISGITSRTHILKMDVEAVEKAILAEPYVLRVEVHRRFPHTVILEITERTPVGCLLQNGRFHLVDREGLVVESTDSRREGIPEIIGLRLPLLYPGVRLEDPRFADVERLLEEMPGELRERAEEVGYTEGEEYYLVAKGTRIIFGECDDLARKMEIAMAALQDIAPRYGQLLYIDVTYPDHPAIRPR